jgi:putative transposase
LLALIVNRLFNVKLHSATLYRHLRQVGIVWRRVAPTLNIKDSHYKEKRLAIARALNLTQTEHPVFYQDEIEIDLNPKIGAN